MLGRRLYSGISRGAGAARTSAPPAHHASASSSSASTSTSASTRGRTKSNRQTVRVRSLYSPPRWVSQLIHGQAAPSVTTSRSLEQGGMALRSVPIESIESLLGSRGIATGASRRGRQRPFASRRSSITNQAPEKSMAQLIKEAKPLVQNPLAKDYTFRPIPLYPAAFHSHLAFNPPHLPIPANLGTAIYSQPRRTPSASAPSASSTSNSAEDLFSAPPPPSPLRKLGRAQAKSQTAMTEHMSIISALSHPAHLAALPTGFETLAATPLGMGMGDVEEHLARTLAEAETKNQILAERDFAKAMEVLEGKGKAQKQDEASKQVDVGQEGQVQMDEVLQGVEALLGRLTASAGADAQVDMGMGEDVVEMDSVKRKRKKKISKHKYKKRRKATRAQRKRLGK